MDNAGENTDTDITCIGHLYLSMLPRAECLLALGTLEAEAVPIFTEGGLSLS